MEGDLIELLQRFSLEGNEISGAKLELEDLTSGVKDCKGSLIGRIMGEKIANFTGVKNFVTAAWSYPRNLTVMELGPNVLQFNIPNQEDKEKNSDRRTVVDGQSSLSVEQMVRRDRRELWCLCYCTFVGPDNLLVHWLTKR